MQTSPEAEVAAHTNIHIDSDKPGYYAGVPNTENLAFKGHEKELSEELIGAWHGLILPLEENVSVGAPQCQRCEVLPRPMTEAGSLELRFPHTFTLGKTLQFLMENKWEHSQQNGLVNVRVKHGALPALVSALSELMSGPEQRDVRAVFHFEGDLIEKADYFEVESFPDFVEEVRSTWLIEMLRAQAIYSVFQPIVRMPHNGEVPEIFGYECLMRGEHEGNMVMPDTMLQMARGADLIFQLDLAARRAAIVGAGLHGIKEKIFVNFSPNSIYDPWHCLRSTVNAVKDVGLSHDQVVFEITESEKMPTLKHLQRIVDFYREEGFQVALDDVGSGYSSLNVLVQLKPDFVKLDMGLVRDVDRDPAKAIVARKLIETVRELELATVAEGIERVEELNWVRETGGRFRAGLFSSRAPAVPPPFNRFWRLEKAILASARVNAVFCQRAWLYKAAYPPRRWPRRCLASRFRRC